MEPILSNALYDEAVCGTSSHTRWNGNGYPWCEQQDPSGCAIDANGNVIDSGCPCTVQNPIAPLGATGFIGWGTNMLLHVYDIMWPGYVPPTSRNNFQPVTLPPTQSVRNCKRFNLQNSLAGHTLTL